MQSISAPGFLEVKHTMNILPKKCNSREWYLLMLAHDLIRYEIIVLMYISFKEIYIPLLQENGFFTSGLLRKEKVKQ